MARMIDKDDLLKAIYGYNEDSIDVDSLTDMIEDAPTVESKKGEWVDVKTFGIYHDTCSECGATKAWLNTAKQPIAASNRFCYNCGARMEE